MNIRTKLLKNCLAVMVVVASLGFGLSVLAGGYALADQPQKQTFFICPSVSTNNSNGMWVIGMHGGYYVLIPRQGPGGSRVFLTIPVQVASLAEIPAGWALYNALPSYPNFVGMAMLLQEGIDHWLGGPAGWQEGDMASVRDNGDGTYTVADLSQGLTITINQPIPLASAAIW